MLLLIAALVDCFVYKFALSTKEFLQNVLLCLNRVIKTTKFVEMSALNARLFRPVFLNMGPLLKWA